MILSAQLIQELVADRTFDDFSKDRLSKWATFSQFVILGEAANRVPQLYQELSPDVPWARVIGLRNRLVDGHESVDWEILYTIAQLNLPDLVASLQELLDSQRS